MPAFLRTLPKPSQTLASPQSRPPSCARPSFSCVSLTLLKWVAGLGCMLPRVPRSFSAASPYVKSAGQRSYWAGLPTDGSVDVPSAATCGQTTVPQKHMIPGGAIGSLWPQIVHVPWQLVHHSFWHRTQKMQVLIYDIRRRWSHLHPLKSELRVGRTQISEYHGLLQMISGMCACGAAGPKIRCATGAPQVRAQGC